MGGLSVRIWSGITWLDKRGKLVGRESDLTTLFGHILFADADRTVSVYGMEVCPLARRETVSEFYLGARLDEKPEKLDKGLLRLFDATGERN